MQSIRNKRCLRRMCYFYKLITTQKPLYLFNLISTNLNSLCHLSAYSVMSCRNDYFKSSFITHVWNNGRIMHERIMYRKMEQTEHWNSQFNLLPTIPEIIFKQTYSTLFSIPKLDNVKLLVRLRPDFRHLHEHKFSHNFHDNLNLLYSSNLIQQYF